MEDSQRIRTQVRSMLDGQRRLVRALLRLREQLSGSLFVRYAECGKDGCSCRRGERHGPYYVLSMSKGNRAGFAYLDAIQANRAQALVRRHREFQNGMKQLRRVNIELMDLLRRYRNAMAQRGQEVLRLQRSRSQNEKSVI